MTNHARILVVAPYSQRLGVAVFAESNLLHYAVKTFRLPRTPQSVRAETSAHIKDLIKEFTPDRVIVKKLSRRQLYSRNQRNVLDQITVEAKISGLQTVQLSFEDAKRDLSVETHTTNSDMFRVLKLIYPELDRFSHFQNRHQREYYVPLLTAVAIGNSRTPLSLTN